MYPRRFSHALASDAGPITLLTLPIPPTVIQKSTPLLPSHPYFDDLHMKNIIFISYLRKPLCQLIY